MALVSTLTIGGNLVADPELRADRNGKPICRIRIASTPRRRNPETQQWEDGDPVYMSCTAFGEMAENIASTLTKGMRVVVHGTLKQDEWTDKESGTKKSDKSMNIEDIGPSLMFAAYSKRDKRSAGSSSGGDDWASGSATDDMTPF